jgi:hypothetical protein
MARTLVMLAVALAAASCASRDASSEPPWLADSISQAEAASKGYPPLSQFPAETPTGGSYDEWRTGLSDMAAIRDQVLTDSAAETPDQAAVDAATFAREQRADTARELERATVDEDE